MRFEVLPEGTRWPKSDYHSVAVLPIAGQEIAARLGTSLHRGVEVGLGEWEGIGIRLGSDTLVEFVNHVSSPPPGGFEVRIDGDAEVSRALGEVLAILGVPLSACSWLSPRVV